MKKIKLGTGFAVSVIFFGIALLEAFQRRNWPGVIFWAVTGAVFLLADNLDVTPETSSPHSSLIDCWS